MSVLTVQSLTVSVDGDWLVDDVSFEIEPGERVGLIGESGSGKTLTASAVMGLVSDELTVRGSIRLNGKEIVGARERELARSRGRDMAMVFQEPMTALNPTMRVGKQVAEAMLVHRTRPDRRDATKAAAELLDLVQLPDRAAKAYPHQLSGGQRQRVMLAMALANDPSLLICDEPTTALDVTVQKQILELILAATDDKALLFITHDLAVVASVCERVMVMRDGKIVESGPVQDVFTSPSHEYTEHLLAVSLD